MQTHVFLICFTATPFHLDTKHPLNMPMLIMKFFPFLCSTISSDFLSQFSQLLRVTELSLLAIILTLWFILFTDLSLALPTLTTVVFSLGQERMIYKSFTVWPQIPFIHSPSRISFLTMPIFTAVCRAEEHYRENTEKKLSKGTEQHGFRQCSIAANAGKKLSWTKLLSRERVRG